MQVSGKCRCDRTILGVDDEDEIRETIRELLEEEGFQVLPASNGRDALEVLAGGPSPCVVLLDLMMPVMNGWEFAREFRARYGRHAARIVVVTAAENAQLRAREIEADGWLEKPFDLDAVLDAVALHLSQPFLAEVPRSEST